ncbi:sporulation protein YqfD [Cytobacillus sp. FJAT-54145]|uniref:Sporulation protein YqfD n=1 Tax=Cytobacillus spartinae TaxID=3299023 RepID=A0ABW6KHH8_9BACI
MKNHWIQFYSGIITVKVTGQGVERLLNTLTRNNMVIWDVKRHGTHSLTFKVNLQDAKKIRHAVRNSDCKIEFLRRAGIPFLIKRLLKNSGFMIGVALFIISIFVLSNMVWGIQIQGADPATEYKIRKHLHSVGVKKGQFQFFLSNPEGIQRSIIDNVEGLTWVGVELKGTTYHLQVVEKTEPEKPEKLGPRNIVAKKKAVIVDMFIEEGDPQVQVHDHVQKGQLLVSGLIGKEGETKSVPAKGQVLGETWYKSQVLLPLETNFQVFNGNEKTKHYIKIGNLSIPFWGFGKVEFPKYEKEANEKNIHFLKWTLPISYIQHTFRESEDIKRTYSKEEAIEVAKEMARRDIKNQLSENATIKGEKVLHQTIENGKVNLSIHFQVIEDIAQGQPIIQGELE